ncbi:unnamed protein product, partial [Ectocarpus sp. 12 AP-2014]
CVVFFDSFLFGRCLCIYLYGFLHPTSRALSRTTRCFGNISLSRCCLYRNDLIPACRFLRIYLRLFLRSYVMLRRGHVLRSRFHGHFFINGTSYTIGTKTLRRNLRRVTPILLFRRSTPRNGSGGG